jgi:hypothetical protein
LVDFVTIWLALSGIIYAVRHEGELAKQTRNIEVQLAAVKEVKDSLPTKRIGLFPDYVEKIEELAKSASRSLDIMADCGDYGSFFAPEKHKNSHRAILGAIQETKGNVRILVCGPPEALSGASGMHVKAYMDKYDILKEQYFEKWFAAMNEDVGFVSWLNDLLNEHKDEFIHFAEWLRRWEDEDIKTEDLKSRVTKSVEALKNKNLEKTESDAEIFHTLLQARQKRFLDALDRVGATVKHLGCPLKQGRKSAEAIQPLFLWIKDYREENDYGGKAVFGFSSPTQGTRQSGFVTEDTQLLETFMNIFKERWEDGTPWKG